MAKKQTRRTISLERQFYEAIQAHSKAIGKSASEYVTRVVHADMLAKGADVPPLGHFASGPRGVIKPEEIKPRVRPAEAPDDKYRAALEFQRQQLAKPVPIPKVHDKSKECWWCGDTFRAGEIPSEVDGKKLHGKCKREIARSGGIEG